MLRLLKRVLTLCVSTILLFGVMLIAGSFRDAAGASTLRKPTLLEFIRTSGVHTSALAQPTRNVQDRR